MNVSEAERGEVVAEMVASAGPYLLDVHADAHHGRSVLTLAGPDPVEPAMAVAGVAVARIDLGAHRGAHPRVGAVDVVPFVPVPGTGASLDGALGARDRFAARAAAELGVPCFLYGPERALPEVRRRAFTSLSPDVGSARPHPTAGASCVGARPVLMAYNLWLAPSVELETARQLASAVRGHNVRALAFDLGGIAQVSFNLLDPLTVGPAEVFDAVAAQVAVERAEVVGLVPAAVLRAVPRHRWAELDLDPGQTIEARLEQAGLDGGSLGAS